MRARHTRILTHTTRLRTALTDAATAARTGYQQIADTNTTAIQAINNAELDGYQLADNGTATITPAQTATAAASPQSQAALIALEHGAATHTATVQTALAGLGTADTASAITTAFTPLTEATDIAAPLRATSWVSIVVDIGTALVTIPLDDIGVGEGIDAAVFAAMKEADQKALTKAAQDAAAQAAKNGASKKEATQAAKDAAAKYAREWEEENGPAAGATKQQYADQAKKLGYNQRVPAPKLPFKSHGQPGYTNGKNYITPDVDAHNVSNGWKMMDRRGGRMGTYAWNLKPVKG